MLYWHLNRQKSSQYRCIYYDFFLTFGTVQVVGCCINEYVHSAIKIYVYKYIYIILVELWHSLVAVAMDLTRVWLVSFVSCAVNTCVHFHGQTFFFCNALHCTNSRWYALLEKYDNECDALDTYLCNVPIVSCLGLVLTLIATYRVLLSANDKHTFSIPNCKICLELPI